MPDTRASKTTSGWLDLDTPGRTFKTRREVREYRRSQRNAPVRSAMPTFRSSNLRVSFKPAVSLTSDGDSLTSLQDKLYKRLTNHQGVSIDDAMAIIKANGYNKAASYGHMRAAGATHHEAKIVIDLSNPDVSAAYGKARADGFNHTDALSKALRG